MARRRDPRELRLGNFAKQALVLLAALITAAGATAARAEDSGRPRFYLGLRGMGTNPATGVHDPWGVSLGFNLNRFWGFELAADSFERFPEVGGRSIGEYGIAAVVPEVRFRYPLLGDRLTPYVLGGFGVAFTDLNDVKGPGLTASIEHESSSWVGAVGAGLEYFIADNVAVGAEVKYLAIEDQTLSFNGERRTLGLDSLLTSFSMRVFLPELRPAPLAEQRPEAPLRIYLAARAGGAVSTGGTRVDGFRVDPEPPAYFSVANQFFGLALGADFHRHLGAELAVEGYEVRLTQRGVGSIGEYSIGALLPLVRLRYPLLDGRVVPYLIGGLGVSHGEFNDTKPRGKPLDIAEGNSYGLAASLGGGVEWFVASNVAFGLESRYLTSRGHSLRIDGRTRDADLDAVMVALTLKVVLVDLPW